jgi:predicted DNA-binding transcriptional regulator YafY
MLRKDRLFDLIQILRDGRLHRAQDIADRLQISLRTVYRDMDTLIASGVPIEGARGLGYMATAAITLPPLNLSVGELAALQQGLSYIAGTADDALQTAARSLLAKLDAVLPDVPQTAGFAVYPFADAARGFQHLPALRAAIKARQKLGLTYRNTAGQLTERAVRPLQLDSWGRVWTVTVWCELRSDFRVLRVDRIETLKVLSQLFIDEPGKSLADFRARNP